MTSRVDEALQKATAGSGFGLGERQATALYDLATRMDEELKAAEKLSSLYFFIASEAIGEDAVRQKLNSLL